MFTTYDLKFIFGFIFLILVLNLTYDLYTSKFAGLFKRESFCCYNLSRYEIAINISAQTNILVTSSQTMIRKNERVIIYLLNRERINDWISSLNLLFNNFLREFRYKILVFHNAALTKQELIDMGSATG